VLDAGTVTGTLTVWAEPDAGITEGGILTFTPYPDTLIPGRYCVCGPAQLHNATAIIDNSNFIFNA
jgi:hypothetical protein